MCHSILNVFKHLTAVGFGEINCESSINNQVECLIFFLEALNDIF